MRLNHFQNYINKPKFSIRIKSTRDFLCLGITFVTGKKNGAMVLDGMNLHVGATRLGEDENFATKSFNYFKMLIGN